MKLNLPSVFAVCMVLLLAAAGHTAELRSYELSDKLLSLNGMAGLREVGVLVEVIDEDFGRMAGISRQQVQTQAELYLRKIPGLKICDSFEPSRPHLYVNISAQVYSGAGNSSGGYGAILVSLRQDAYLARTMPSTGKPILVHAVSTWRTGSSFTCGTGVDAGEFVMNGLSRKLDQFQNEYLKANADVRP